MPKRISVSPKPATRRPTFVKEWRNYRRMSQEGLAELVGTTASTISRIETGIQPYTQDTLELLARELNCEPADLIMRNPLDSEAPWSIWETLKPAEKRAAVEIMKTIKRSGEEAA